MQKFNSMSELIAYMAHKNTPNELQNSTKDRRKEIEECNAGGASAFMVIAENQSDAAEAEKAYLLSTLLPEVDEYLNTLDGVYWRCRVYVTGDDGSGIIYYERVPLL